MQLAPEVRQAVRDALLDAFPTEAALEDVCYFHLGSNLDQLAGPGRLATRARGVLEWAETNDRIDQLVKAMRKANPDNRMLRAVEAAVVRGVPSADPSGDRLAQSVLESIVGGAGYHDYYEWRARLDVAASATCRVDWNGRPAGSGFLIGASTVLTCAHVVTEKVGGRPASQLAVRFGADGRRFTVRAVGRVSPELDAAELELAEAPEAAPLELAALLPNSGAPLLILEHPDGQPLQIGLGRAAEVRDDRLLHDVDTLPGASGSPCFTADWQLVGMHQRRPSGGEKLNGARTSVALARWRVSTAHPGSAEPGVDGMSVERSRVERGDGVEQAQATSLAKAQPLPPSFHADLRAWLISAFSTFELRELARRLPGDLHAHLPEGVSAYEYADRLVELALRHGVARPLVELGQESRPLRAHEIAALWAAVRAR